MIFRIMVLVCSWLMCQSVFAFCGFYVAKADAKLFNKASKVVMVRDEDKTVITMVNDYQGDMSEFAMIVPVPQILQRGQIHVTENAIVDHLDAYTAPRLVEYFDANPCEMMHVMEYEMARAPRAMMSKADRQKSAKALGVKIEAEYTVGEYDILILSAEESDGLVKWLKQNDYKLPKGAKQVVGSYLKQDVKFFVAKINLDEQEKSGRQFLRPLQIAFESEKFMLPIRLGTLNADGQQELFVFALSKNGRVETANYRTVKIPSGMDVPLYVKDDFSKFYTSLFDTAVKKENGRAVFMEYAWDMNWCDPCAADPLSRDELRELGVFWLEDKKHIKPMGRRAIQRPRPVAQNVYVTRLHVRYDADTFPEDLQFKQTSDRRNFQARFVLRHPWTGDVDCSAGKAYQNSLPERFEKEAQSLAQLTSWEINDIRRKMQSHGQSFEPPEPRKWWQDLWQND